jgi:glycosyltransferase involved in cell wall biosynthesis
LAIQEAMVYGLPIVVGEADGTHVDLVTSENGWHVRPGDPEDLRRVLREGLSNSQRLQGMGEASFQIVRDRANIEIMVRTFIEAIEFARHRVK